MFCFTLVSKAFHDDGTKFIGVYVGFAHTHTHTVMSQNFVLCLSFFRILFSRWHSAVNLKQD
jgi:hypothetical protein